MKKIRKERGITLIALVITIIILLILAGVSIATLVGENGILVQATDASEKTEKAAVKEEIELSIISIKMNHMGKNLSKSEILNYLQTEEKKEIVILDSDLGIIEYKEYKIEITDKLEVIIKEKLTGEKPNISITKSTEEITSNGIELTITMSTVDVGGLKKLKLPTGDEQNITGTSTEIKYQITERGTYKFIVEAANGRQAIKIIEINNIIKLPVIYTNAAKYPVVTSTGVISGKITIEYDKSPGLIHYYSTNSVDWKEYTGTITQIANSISAKSMVKGTNESSGIATADTKIATDAIGVGAYDGNKDAGYTVPISTSARINIDASIYGKELNMKYNGSSQSWGSIVNAVFYNESGTVLSSIGLGSYYSFAGTVKPVVPENTAYMRIECPHGGTLHLHELWID